MARLPVLLVVIVMLLAAAPATEAVIVFEATLTNDQETTPVVPTTTTGDPRPESFGTAVFVLNDDSTALSFSATIFNIDVTGLQTPDTNDNLVNAHIHAGPLVTPATNGPVVWGFFGTPFNNDNPNDGVVTPFEDGVGGTFSGTWNVPEGNNTTLLEQLPNIFAERSYINFHTVQFGGGEIRGAITLVPEPSVIALLGTGALPLIALGWRAARRKRGA